MRDFKTEHVLCRLKFSQKVPSYRVNGSSRMHEVTPIGDYVPRLSLVKCNLKKAVKNSQPRISFAESINKNSTRLQSSPHKNNLPDCDPVRVALKVSISGDGSDDDEMAPISPERRYAVPSSPHVDFEEASVFASPQPPLHVGKLKAFKASCVIKTQTNSSSLDNNLHQAVCPSNAACNSTYGRHGMWFTKNVLLLPVLYSPRMLAKIKARFCKLRLETMHRLVASHKITSMWTTSSSAISFLCLL